MPILEKLRRGIVGPPIGEGSRLSRDNFLGGMDRGDASGDAVQFWDIALEVELVDLRRFGAEAKSNRPIGRNVTRERLILNMKPGLRPHSVALVNRKRNLEDAKYFDFVLRRGRAVEFQIGSRPSPNEAAAPASGRRV